MTDWSRYRLRTLDEVILRLGAETWRPSSGAYGWATRKGGILRVVTYTQDRQSSGIQSDQVELIARRLAIDPEAVFRLLRQRGGEILDI